MYEMVKKIIGAWPPGEGCWPPTAGPHPEQRPLSRRRGPGPLRRLGAGHGALPIRGHSARARHPDPAAEPVSPRSDLAEGPGPVVQGGGGSAPGPSLRLHPPPLPPCCHCSGDATLLVLILMGALDSESSVSFPPEWLCREGPDGLHKWRSGTAWSGLWSHRSGALLLLPSADAVSWRAVSVGTEWWPTGRPALAL